MAPTSRLPTFIKIGWRMYQVTTDSQATPNAGHDHDGFGGMSYHEEGVIWVREGSREQQRETLLHEVCHCVIAVTGLQSQLKEACKYSEDPEEIYISAISSGLMGVLIDNPSLFKYIST